ncbi:MAG: hypothetical protein KF810_21305 [Rhizobiaceae bacterium]|nr:hypothetical protein [Rhizobiaceae bacterium]
MAAVRRPMGEVEQSARKLSLRQHKRKRRRQCIRRQYRSSLRHSFTATLLSSKRR